MYVSSGVMHPGIDLPALARQLLGDGGYTTKTLGQAVGLSQPSISRLAAGKTREIGASAAIRLICLAGGKVEAPATQDTAVAQP